MNLLVELGYRPLWQDEAACRDHDPMLFFSAKTYGAKRVCRGCPVRRDCLEYAIANRELIGVWGGMCPTERWRLIDARGQW